MLKSKILYTIEPKEYSTIGVKFSTIGIFNTEKVHWDYYAVSYFPKNGKNHVSGDIGGCNFMVELSIESVKNYGKSFKTKEESNLFLDEFKDKWETGSNETRQEKRDQKLNDILG